MSWVLAIIMVSSATCWLFSGAASFAYLDLYNRYKTYYLKYKEKRDKKYARYYKMCYKHSFKRLLISIAICIISLIVGYLTL